MMRTVLFLIPTLLLAACQTDAPADTPVDTPTDANSTSTELAISNPYTAAAPAGGTGGVFLTLTGGPVPDTLIAASFAGAERVEVHETYDTADGLRGMREIETGLPVPSGETVELAPGGYHIMLINLSEATAEGNTIQLTLDFAQSGPMEVAVPVVGLDQIRRPAAE